MLSVPANNAPTVDAYARVTALLRDELGGEHVVSAVQLSTRRWYTQVAELLTRAQITGEHYWWLVLTETRVFILRREDDNEGRPDWWKFQAPRSDVEVELFTRTGIASWWLVVKLGTDRWSLHSLTLFGLIPFGGSTPRKGREVAESLGWKPRHER